RLGNRVIFSARSSLRDHEVWVSDGTSAGTKVLTDIRVGLLGSEPRYFYRWGDKVIFTATTFNGRALYMTDGTPAGTRQITKSVIGGGGVYFAAVGSKLVFVSWTLATGSELWETDGTAAGTKLLKGIGLGSVGGLPMGLVSWMGKVYFSARNSTNGIELWVTDGTSAGTKMVKDIRPKSGSGNPQHLTIAGRYAFCVANDGTHGSEIWRTDGTQAGTNDDTGYYYPLKENARRFDLLKAKLKSKGDT
ncbi:MAG: hypothetical protein IIC31_06690, partial [Chloroflexi bacterium]|nr:hypothetical protein [Chloroflexota bacterium]